MADPFDPPTEPGVSARRRPWWVRAWIPLAVALVVSLLLFFTRTAPEKKSRPKSALSVSVAPIRSARALGAMPIGAEGRVMAVQDVQLRAEVSAKIVWKSRRFLAGQSVKRGEALLKLEQRDIRAQVAQQRAAVAQAELQYSQEKQRAELALDNWRSLQESEARSEQAPSDLTAREPQLRLARAQLSAAKAALDQAQHNLERTVIRAPFDGVIQEENADVGGFLQAQTIVGRCTSLEQEVEVLVPKERLRWLRAGEEGAATAARVYSNETTTSTVHKGYLTQLHRALDSTGGQARVVVAMEPGASGTRLLLNDFVHLELLAAPPENVWVTPNASLYDNGVLVVQEDAKSLRIVPVTVVYRGRTHTWVRGDFSDRASAITSRVSAPVAGMPISVMRSP